MNKATIARFMELGEQLGMFECPLTGTYVYPEDLKYDSSWDMLMPVLEKIFYKVAKDTEGMNMVIGLQQRILNLQLAPVYEGVVEFINLYNTQ